MKVPVSIYQSVSVLDGEDLVNKAYAGILGLMDTVKPNSSDLIGVYRIAGDSSQYTKGEVGKVRPDRAEFISGLQCGVYIPGTKRDYWCGNFDVGVDEFPQQGCVYCSPDEKDGEDFAYVHVKKMAGFADNIITQCKDPVARYKVSHVSYHPSGIPWDAEIKTVVRVSYIAISKDGCIYTCYDRLKMREFGAVWTVRDAGYTAFHWGAGALSLLSDRKYLWLVETQETITDLSANAKMQFGVDPEMVKSLFYSRTIPMTSSGRLRPILHWVDSHKRRIKEGVDINIEKHLRGISQFQIGGLNFNITSPTKPVKQENQLLTK